jgi:hypothetical protein
VNCRVVQLKAWGLYYVVIQLAMTMNLGHKHVSRCAGCKISKVQWQLRGREVESMAVKSVVLDLMAKAHAKEEERYNYGHGDYAQPGTRDYEVEGGVLEVEIGFG